MPDEHTKVEHLLSCNECDNKTFLLYGDGDRKLIKAACTKCPYEYKFVYKKEEED